MRVPRKLEKRTHQRRTVAALTDDQREAVLDFVDSEYRRGHPVQVTVRLLLHTGLRQAEAAHLPPERVYTNDGVPTVEVAPVDCDCSYCRRQARHNGGVSLNDMWGPKSEAGEREVPVYDDTTWELLRESHPFGVTPSSIGKRVAKVQEHFQFEPKFTSHVARHSFASMLHGAGVGINRIADDLGHVSTQTTRIYIQEPYVKRAKENRKKVLGR